MRLLFVIILSFIRLTPYVKVIYKEWQLKTIYFLMNG